MRSICSENPKNLERLFTHWGWLRSASNFGKTCFRWSPTFHFSMPGKKKIDKIFDKKFRLKNSPKNCFRKLPVLEERRYFGPHQQIRLEKWPPILSFSDLCDFWQKGNKAYFDFFPDFWRNMTSSPGGVIQGVTMVWWYDDMICWHDDIMIRDPRSPGLTWPPPRGKGGRQGGGQRTEPLDNKKSVSNFVHQFLLTKNCFFLRGGDRSRP